MSSSLGRTIRNFLRIGPREYLRQLNRIDDAKYGVLRGVDAYGNKYYENDKEDEIFLRTRWVDYKGWYYDPTKVEPGWRGWLHYTVDYTPNELPKDETVIRATEPPGKTLKYENMTGTLGAYVPYSTVRPKMERCAWEPKVQERV